MRNRNIILIIAGSALVIVILALIGRWTMSGAQPPSDIGSDTDTSTSTGFSTSSTPTAASTTVTTTITQADKGKTASMKVGTRFLLDLGAAQNWSVAIGDSTVVRLVPNASVAQGTQGLFEVLRPGTTTLSAEGRPICKAGEMCAQYIISFSMVIRGV